MSQIRNRSRSQIRGSTDKFDYDDKIIATPPQQVVPVGSDKSAESKLQDNFISTRRRQEPATAFSGISAFGLCFAVLNTWCVLVVSLGSGLSTGGPSSLVWGFVYAIVCNLALTLSLGEIFSVYPTAGGQYHWSSIFSNPKWRPLVSWITATTNMIGLWSGVSTQAYLASSLYQTIGVVANPEFSSTTGISYAIYVAVCVAGCISCVLFTPRMNRWLDTGMMVMSVLGCLTLVIVILAMSKNKATASFVFTETANQSGWDNMIIPWLLGLLQSAFSFIGVDIVFHISEEMPHADVEGPKILNMTIIIGGISGLVVLLSMLFAINDLDAILGSIYGLPFAQICMNATDSKAFTILYLLLVALLFSYGARGCQLTAARLAMSLARDGGLPFPRQFQYIVSGQPVLGLILAAVAAALFGLVQFGSTNAFSSLLGTAVILLQISYVVPVVLMLYSGRAFLNKHHPDRKYNLGRAFGITCNLVSIFFVLQSIVIYCFPYTMPVTAGNMNYVTAFVGGIYLCLFTLWGLYMRFRFAGPKEEEILAIVAKARGISSLSYQMEMDGVTD